MQQDIGRGNSALSTFYPAASDLTGIPALESFALRFIDMPSSTPLFIDTFIRQLGS